MGRTGLTAAVLGIAVVMCAGCGSGQSAGTAPTSTPAASPPEHPGALVKAILPADVPGTRPMKTTLEDVNDQLAPKWMPANDRRDIDALVHRSWLASGHAVFQLTDHKVALEVDVNLFRTTADAARMWKLESAAPPAPKEQLVSEHVPPGASPGSSYRCSSAKGYSGCTLAWRQGATIAFVLILGKGPSALNPGVADGLAPRLLPVQLQVAKSIFAHCDMSDGVLRQAV
jgi:hypothetical protein